MKFKKWLVAIMVIMALVGGVFAPELAMAAPRKKSRIVRRAKKRHVRKRRVVRKRRRSRKARKVAAYQAPATVAAGGTLADAQAILETLVARHPELQQAPVTVEFGDARGYQAVTYYTIGRIVISPTHSASLDTILRHEVGHIVDWRDNGVIDWGENLPAM